MDKQKLRVTAFWPDLKDLNVEPPMSQEDVWDVIESYDSNTY